MPTAPPMTAAEFIALPVPERGRPWNLIGGEVVVNEPSPLHQHVQRKLLLALDSWVSSGTGRGTVWLPLDVRLDNDNVFAPNILWYAESRGPRLHAVAPSPLPDLAVEIRSPATWRFDIGAKMAAYERHGLSELWLVDTAADAVLVYRRSARESATFDVALELGFDDGLTSPQLEGFEVRLVDVFPKR